MLRESEVDIVCDAGLAEGLGERVLVSARDGVAAAARANTITIKINPNLVADGDQLGLPACVVLSRSCVCE
jgi:hypothetical protein